MKVKFAIIIPMLLACFARAGAQDAGNIINAENGNMVFCNSKGEELVQMEGRKNSFSLFVSGFEISFGTDDGGAPQNRFRDTDSPLRRSTPACCASGKCACGVCRCKPDAPVNRYYQDLYAALRYRAYRLPAENYIGSFELGVNYFHSPDYGLYTADQRGFLKLDHSKSIGVTWNIVKLSRNITRSGRLGFTTGLGISWNNYVFDHKITLAKNDNGMLYPMALPDDTKKSKLMTFSPKLTAVVGARFGNFHISGGMYGEYIARAHTKYKSPSRKSSGSMLNIEEFQAGLTANVGIKNFKIFGKYQLTDYFKHGKGPQTNVYTIGVSLF